MRSTRWARWATCALAISICIPALADRGRARSLAECTTFEQADKGDDKVAMSIKNSCKMPVDCALSWRVVCAPDAKKRRTVHPSAAKLALSEGATESAEASATVCGDDAWTIDSIQWSCEPNKD
jgi:hypothetical protein